MRRISLYIPLLAAVATVCMAGQLVLAGVAASAANPTIDKTAINNAVQEALAKAQAGQGGVGTTPGSTAPAPSGESLGSSGSLSKLTEGGEEEATPTVPTTTSSTASSRLSMGVLVPIFIAGALMLGGIAYFIVRDARSVAPAGDGLGGSQSAQRAVRQRKRRAKAKAARQQRKRNR